MKTILLSLLLLSPAISMADGPIDIKTLIFNAYDTNKNSFLSATEFRNGMGMLIGMAAADEIFGVKDVNGDGKLSLDEFKGTPTTE